MPDAVQGAGSQRCPGLASSSLTNLPALKEMRARLEGTELRAGGRGSSGQQIEREFDLFLRRGVAAVPKESKRRKGEKGITILPSF